MIKKGTLYLANNQRDLSIPFFTCYFESHGCTIPLSYSVEKVKVGFKTNIDPSILTNAIRNHYADSLVDDCRIDDYTQEVIDEYCKDDFSFFKKSINIIYEEFKGIDGITYGRELLTGLIFPVSTYSNTDRTSHYRINVYRNSKFVDVDFYQEVVVNVDSMDKVGCFIKSNGVADTNEIDFYNDIKDGIIKLKTRFMNNIRDWYNTNVYKYEIVERKEKTIERVKQSSETIIMENIEYLLTILEGLDKDLFIKYNDRYNSLINGDDNLLKLESLNTTNLLLLQNEIELELEFKKRNVNNLNDYINSYRIEYLNNLNDGVSTKITIKDLDRIYELFIKIKNNYSINNQREFIKNISFLYLMELYENRDSISIDELNNSYCTDIIRSILINLIALIDIEVFENNMELELNNDVNVEMLFNIINSLKIKEKNKVKLLIKE